jgi:NhaA family Na+:H+ antiporter
LFGLASAGVEIDSVVDLAQPLPLGVALGLFLGKQFGVFGAIWIACRTGFAPRVRDTSWAQLYGASVLCGIGFTMSLFIGTLAFPANPELADAAKIGVLAGSLAAGILGFLILRFAPYEAPCVEDQEQAGELFCADQGEELVALPAPPEPELLEDRR